MRRFCFRCGKKLTFFQTISGRGYCTPCEEDIKNEKEKEKAEIANIKAKLIFNRS